MKSSTLLLCLTSMCLLTLQLNAQQSIFLRAGIGRGESPKAVAQLGLRFPVSGRLHGVNELGVIVSPFACDAGSTSLQCEYGGRLAAVGLAAALLSAPRLVITGSGTAGMFHR